MSHDFDSGKNPFADQDPFRPQTGPGGHKPLPPGSVKTYLLESILLFVCCSGLFAIPAIVYAAQTSGKLSSGDYEGAMQTSENAKNWCIIALVAGLMCNGILGALSFMSEAQNF